MQSCFWFQQPNFSGTRELNADTTGTAKIQCAKSNGTNTHCCLDRGIAGKRVTGILPNVASPCVLDVWLQGQMDRQTDPGQSKKR